MLRDSICMHSTCACVRVCALACDLTSLQVRVGLAQAPVDAAVTVRLLKELVQNLPDSLPLVHHQRLVAAVSHQDLYEQLREEARSRPQTAAAAERTDPTFLTLASFSL